MKGVIYNGIHDIAVRELPIPQPTANDIVVKVMRNGICGSDLHAYNLGGDDIGILKGGALGHEFVGIIVAVGDNVAGLHVDDHVFVNPSRAKGSTSQLAMAGGLSQLNLIHHAVLDDNVFLLPRALSFDRAVVIEPYAVGIHGKNIAHPHANQNFCVFGAGPVGLASASGLIRQGMTNVAVVDIDNHRLAFAKRLGAHTINSQETDLTVALKKLFGVGVGLMGDERIGVDTYIDCVGLPRFLTDFINEAKFGAKFVVVALGAETVTFKPQYLAMNEISLLGSAIYTTADIKETIANVIQSDNVFPEIVSAHYPLAESEQAFRRAATDKTALKVVIDVNN